MGLVDAGKHLLPQGILRFLSAKVT